MTAGGQGCPRAGARSGCATVEGMPRALVPFGGANPERTTYERPSRPDTHEQEHAGQPARDGTTRHQPTVRVRVRDEVLMPSPGGRPRG
jgi:hypothetical protein